MIRILVFAAAAFGLAACASSTSPALPYRAAPTSTALGYSETQIESNRYFVRYRVTSPAEVSQLEDYALLRSAELTLENGRDWFWVDRRTLDQQEDARSSGPSIGVGIGGGSYGRRSGASVGVGMTFPLGNREEAAPRARSTTFEIRFGEGPKPNDANAYDARSTAQSLRSRLPPAG